MHACDSQQPAIDCLSAYTYIKVLTAVQHTTQCAAFLEGRTTAEGDCDLTCHSPCFAQRANRRANANTAPGPMPPAQFQPGYGMGAPYNNAPPPPGSYQPFDVYHQQYPQPYPTSGPAAGPATGTPAYGGQYDAGAAPIYGGGYPPQNAGPADFSKPTYGPPGGAPRY